MTATPRPVLASSSVERAVRFIAEHHCEPVDVTDLAAAAGYSRHHFSRAFTSTIGISPSAYLTAARIDTAKRLLLAERCPVIDVAVEVGFDSLSSFTRRFNATVGITPARFRSLAGAMEGAELRPFAVAMPAQPTVDVSLLLPDAVSDSSRVWLGWYPTPAPIGLPAAGVLRDYDDQIRLPLHPHAPWLLGFVVEPADDHLHQLAPRMPVVARHPQAITRPCTVTLAFRRAGVGDVPLLSALPALAH